jgi:AcrR family transcriptional regulator
MQARLLDAALRVLHEDGALAFTTTRVAEEAGVSVGSLYQYFPNKHALAVALHVRAIEAGWRHVEAMLDEPSWSPRRKMREIAKWFFAVESEEAARFGAVFEDLEVFLRDRAGPDGVERVAFERFTDLIAVATGQPAASPTTTFRAELLMTTLESVGKAVAARGLPPADQERWAVATADMVCDHVGISSP